MPRPPETEERQQHRQIWWTKGPKSLRRPHRRDGPAVVSIWRGPDGGSGYLLTWCINGMRQQYLSVRWNKITLRPAIYYEHEDVVQEESW